MTMRLTAAHAGTSVASLPQKTAVGIGVPSGAAKSRKQHASGFFCRLGASSYGRPGGRIRKARRCSIGTPTPVTVAHPEAIEGRSETLVKAILANVTERQMRVAEILRELGWTHRKLSTGRRENLWVRPFEEAHHDRDY